MDHSSNPKQKIKVILKKTQAPQESQEPENINPKPKIKVVLKKPHQLQENEEKHEPNVSSSTHQINQSPHLFRFVDLFCGIGGFHVALKQLGGVCVMASDIDPECRKIYELNHGLVPQGDVRELGVLPPHDLLCCGFPCQPFSNAGKKKSFDDRRGLLFDQITRLLQINHTPFAILENVKHIKKVSNGLVYQYIYDQLHDIGYQVFDLVLSPKDLKIPQNRERVIFVVIRDDLFTEIKKKQFFEIFELKKTQYQEKNQNLVIFEPNPDPKYQISTEIRQVLRMWDKLIRSLAPTGEIISPVIPEYFTQNESPDNSDWKNGYIKKNRLFYEKYSQIIDPWYQHHRDLLTKKKVYGKLEWQTGGIEPDDTIYRYFIQIRQSGIRVKKTDCFPALVAIVQTSIIANQERYLTPRECTRLQSLPDDFTFGNQSDKLTYKQLGNGINAEIVKIVGEILLNVFKEYFVH